ncbi:hypothetical protein E4K67_12395 [Desulfosporosinus fructosivorans]|uniref:Uncharacterized protein n=2 Tax=Desulfosporosinus fructosivorans TaxID=2018669 RepID=A0A4Z0R390_9FIRM|nr:hypothetical protein E4K67_12395 [Desulfosporosinus fructosivorans]
MKGIGIPMSKLEEREAVVRRKSTVKTKVNDDSTEKTEQPQKAVQSNSEQTDKLIQRSYYLTDKLQKAITIKTAEGDLDKSGVVREALKLYLADILEKI